MSQAKTNEPVDIVYTRCGGATASTVAIRKQWLQEEFAGPGTRLTSLRDNPSIGQSHYDHSVKGMLREGGNIPPIAARAKGADTVVLGITWVDEFQTIVVRAGGDIRTPRDLKGRRLAAPLYKDATIDFQRGSALHGFAHALGIAGLDRKDVEFVDIAIERAGEVTARPHTAAQLEALERGEVDAVFLRQTTGLRLSRQYGDKLHHLVKLSELADPLLRVNNGSPRPVTAHREFLAQHPDIVVRYLAVLLRSAAWAEANASETARLIGAEDGGVDEALVADTFPQLAVSLTPKLTKQYVEGLDAQKNFLRDWGFLAEDFNTRDWIVEGPLEEARQLVAKEKRFAA